jgi:hypothetical protein
MNTKAICLLAASLISSSCLLLPRSRLAVFQYDSVDPELAWSLGSIDVERKTMEAEIARMVPEILTPLAHAYRLPLAGRQEQAPVELDIGIRELEFTRNLDTLNSISYTATLRDKGSGKILAQTIYSEESSETIASFYHLYAVTDFVLKSLSAKLAKQAKKNL